MTAARSVSCGSTSAHVRTCLSSSSPSSLPGRDSAATPKTLVGRGTGELSTPVGGLEFTSAIIRAHAGYARGGKGGRNFRPTHPPWTITPQRGETERGSAPTRKLLRNWMRGSELDRSDIPPWTPLKIPPWPFCPKNAKKPKNPFCPILSRLGELLSTTKNPPPGGSRGAPRGAAPRTPPFHTRI